MSKVERIPMLIPHLGGNEGKYLATCVETNFVSSVGPYVQQFADRFGEFVGSSHAVPCSTGTAALHLALRLFDIKAGDEVWVSDLTFIASANPIQYMGAKAVLVDAELTTWNADEALMTSELTARKESGKPLPKAIIVAHILGQPAQLEKLAPLCKSLQVPLIEDAAEALGARYRTGALEGKHVGTIGDVGAFSFNGNKIITAGGGGMLVTQREDLAQRAKHLSTQARLPGRAYRHDEVGYNYRLTNIAAAVGLAQLEQLPEFIEKKLAIAKSYDDALAGWADVDIPPNLPAFARSAWLYSVRIKGDAARRDGLMEALADEGIETRPIWTPLHDLAPYADAERLGHGKSEDLAKNTLSLPCSVSLKEAEQARVIERLRALLDKTN